MKDIDKQIKKEEKDKRYATDEDNEFGGAGGNEPGANPNKEGEQPGPEPNKAVPNLNINVSADQEQPKPANQTTTKKTTKKTATAEEVTLSEVEKAELELTKALTEALKHDGSE